MDHELTLLTQRLRDFATRRGWDQFHSPKNLAMALTAEAGELAAEFQWIEGPNSYKLDPEHHERVKGEAADVLLYLLRLADQLGFDLAAAANAKIDANERRFPPDVVQSPSEGA